MRIGRAAGWMAAIMCLGLASCSMPPRTVVRNATGAEILLWPLAERPVPLRPGETSGPIRYSAHVRQQALIERGNCLYTYPESDYLKLPKNLRRSLPRIVVVIREDMALSVHQRSKTGVEGPEIVATGFPLKPTTFCGRRGAS